MGVSTHGATPIAGWFISWKILLKWMIQGYPHLWKPPFISPYSWLVHDLRHLQFCEKPWKTVLKIFRSQRSKTDPWRHAGSSLLNHPGDFLGILLPIIGDYQCRKWFLHVLTTYQPIVIWWDSVWFSWMFIENRWWMPSPVAQDTPCHLRRSDNQNLRPRAPETADFPHWE